MKILVVDDDHELRAVVAFALRNAGYLTLEAANGREALDLAGRERPALIVLDLNLESASGHEDGLDLLPELRAKCGAPVLILSVRGSEEQVVRGLDLGADDYMTKPFSPRTLLARLRALLRRSGAEAAHEPLAWGPYRLDLESREFSVAGAPAVRLTPLELRMVQLLIARAGDSVASERLISHVWGAAGEGDRQLLKQLVHRLRQKIERDPAAPVRLVTAAGGYALAG